MDPLPHVPPSLAPGSQTVCYLPWLKVSVALRYVLSFPWTPDGTGRSVDTATGAGSGMPVRTHFVFHETPAGWRNPRVDGIHF